MYSKYDCYIICFAHNLKYVQRVPNTDQKLKIYTLYEIKVFNLNLIFICTVMHIKSKYMKNMGYHEMILF